VAHAAARRTGSRRLLATCCRAPNARTRWQRRADVHDAPQARTSLARPRCSTRWGSTSWTHGSTSLDGGMSLDTYLVLEGHGAPVADKQRATRSSSNCGACCRARRP
jgi:hypothetical protein